VLLVVAHSADARIDSERAPTRRASPEPRSVRDANILPAREAATFRTLLPETIVDRQEHLFDRQEAIVDHQEHLFDHQEAIVDHPQHLFDRDEPIVDRREEKASRLTWKDAPFKLGAPFRSMNDAVPP